MDDLNFRPDGDIGRMTEAYALDAVDFAREHFGVSLSYDRAGVEHLEGILGTFHSKIAEAPSEEHVFKLAKVFGSFLGEALRRCAGGVWGLTGTGDRAVPALQLGDQSLVWPWARAHRRLLEGDEENVLHYFEHLVDTADDPSPRSREDPKTSF